jgi:4-amino-4-deoxy-L-arabinose transferase-like glycosyltransferase
LSWRLATTASSVSQAKTVLAGAEPPHLIKIKKNQQQEIAAAAKRDTENNSDSTNGQMAPPSGGEMPSGGPDGQQGDVQSGGGGPGGGTRGMFGTGNPGPLRLFQSELSGQASWLIPFVLFGIIGLLITGLRGQRKFNEITTETIFWMMWLLPVAAFFSVAGFFHHYYLHHAGSTRLPLYQVQAGQRSFASIRKKAAGKNSFCRSEFC